MKKDLACKRGHPKDAGDGVPTSLLRIAWRKWEVAGLCALLVILVFLVFGQTVRHGFVNYDDDKYVYDNPTVFHGLAMEGIGRAFTRVYCANWHPLTTISHMLDCRFYGLWPGGHHLTNVLLHAAAAVLLFLMLLELTGALWRCGFVAAIFAVHPLRVESVAWVTERKDVLSGVFFMLTLWAYARYARRGNSRGRYTWVLVWFALGLMSKPMLVTVPFVLLLLDYWPLGRFQHIPQLRRLLWEKLPLFALSALSCVATVIAQKEAIQPLEHFPLAMRVGNALVAYSVYLGKMIYPAGLAVLYPYLKNGWPTWQVVAATLLLGALTAWAFLLRRKQPFLVVGWLWYLGMLVPVIGILQVGVQAYADRYTYLPQIGLCIAGTWAVSDWTCGWRYRRLLLVSMAGALLIVLPVAAYHQTSYWRDSTSLWTHTLECTQDNYLACYDLGLALFEKGQTDDAIAQYREALRINPAYAEAHDNLGNSLIRQGYTEEAIAHYREALRINPMNTNTHNNLGVTLFRQGRIEEAIAQYREALQINPAYADAHNNLAVTLFQQGRIEEAIAQYREALRINPAYADAHNNLGNALLRQGQTQEAIDQYRQALRVNPSYSDAHYNLGKALFQQGRTEEAIEHYLEALRINPGLAQAHKNIGDALVQSGKLDEGIFHFRKALELKPGYLEAAFNLGMALDQKGEANEAISLYRKVIEAAPDSIPARNNLAWLLATCPDTSVRNGSMAVELALEAQKLTDGADANNLDTLAAAYAEAGQFPEALEAVNRALQLVIKQGNSDQANDIRARLQLYQKGVPFRETRRMTNDE